MRREVEMAENTFHVFFQRSLHFFAHCIHLLTKGVHAILKKNGGITIQYNIIKYNTIQYNTIQYDIIQYNTIRYNIIQYNNTCRVAVALLISSEMKSFSAELFVASS